MSAAIQKRRKKTSKDERICPFCAQGFNKAEHLHRHVRSHTKEKPFRCQICDRVFARQDTLLRHARSHNSNKPKSPDSCQTSAHNTVFVRDCELQETASPLWTIPAETHAIQDRDGQVQPYPSPKDFPSAQERSTSGNLDDNIGVDMGIATLDPIASPVGTDLGSTTVSQVAFIQHDLHQADFMPWTGAAAEPSLAPFGFLLPADNIDLDGLDLAILNATGGQPDRFPTDDRSSRTGLNDGSRCDQADLGPIDPSLQAIYDTDGYSDVSVKKRWHTFCSRMPSTRGTPDPNQGGYHVDEACHTNLASRLKPRVQEGVLPSVAFLDLCVLAYFANIQPIIPIIHMPMFRPSTQNGLLLLSVCSIGSLFLGSSKAASRGINMYERLNKAILSRWDTLIASSGASSHIAFQASVIGQMFGLLFGRPIDLLQIEVFHGSVVAWSRKMRYLYLEDCQIPLINLDGKELESAWRKWAQHEEKKRTALAMLLLDSEISRIFNHEPSMRVNLSSMPRISSDESFAASTANDWKRIMLNSQISDDNNDCVNMLKEMFPKILTEFEVYVWLERIGAMASERPKPIIPTCPVTTECQDKLTTWMKQYRHTRAFQSQSGSLMILWHSFFMLLNMDIDMLECAAGREGTVTASQHTESAQAWARSSQARNCAVHAIMLQRQFERMPIGATVPIHVPACLYRCGVMWHSYLRFSDEDSLEPGHAAQMRELASLGLEASRTLVEEIAAQAGKPSDQYLYRTIDLLQRISHWRVAERFASTLGALIDHNMGLL